MNPRQAIALAIGTVMGIILVMTPRLTTTPVQVSHKTLPDGTIVDVSRSHPIFWQPPVFALVVLITGYAVIRLRTVKQGG